MGYIVLLNSRPVGTLIGTRNVVTQDPVLQDLISEIRTAGIPVRTGGNNGVVFRDSRKRLFAKNKIGPLFNFLRSKGYDLIESDITTPQQGKTSLPLISDNHLKKIWHLPPNDSKKQS